MSKDYKKYIVSEVWKNKVEQRVEIANHRCELCGRLEKNSRGLQCHHLTYINFGNENVNTDLICLCGRCHLLIHKYLKFLNK